jgi:hypothetical protein
MSERRLGEKTEKRTRPPGSVHVYVATPSYNGRVDSEYSQSLAQAAFTCPLFQVYFTAAVMRGGAFIDLSRNLFVHWFLTSEEFKDCTHLFFIDSDLEFEARAFVFMVKCGQPIVAGAYRRRQETEDYPVALAENPNGGGLWVETDSMGAEFVMADRAPTGFLCISRKVLEEMAAEAQTVDIEGQGRVARLFYTKIDENDRFVGEDFTFCDDYKKKYGKPIAVYPDLEFKHGGFKGNYKAYIQKCQEEAAKTVSTAA